MQESFVLFTESWSGIQLLSREQKGDLLQALMAEHGVCTMPEMDQVTTVVFQMMLPRMRANRKKYEEEIERRKAAGKKGGESRASNIKQSQAKSSSAKECLGVLSSAKQSQVVLSSDKQDEMSASSAKKCQAIQAVSDSDPDTDTDPDFIPSTEGEEETPPLPPSGGNETDSEPEPVQEEVVEDSLPAKKYRREDFVAWYEAYPKHVKKKPAAKSWEKAIKAKVLPSIEFLLADIERQKNGNPRWLDGYIPDTTTYLNERRWNDTFVPRQSVPTYTQGQKAPVYDPNRTMTGEEMLAYYTEIERQLNEEMAQKNAQKGQAASVAIGE